MFASIRLPNLHMAMADPLLPLASFTSNSDTSMPKIVLPPTGLRKICPSEFCPHRYGQEPGLGANPGPGSLNQQLERSVFVLSHARVAVNHLHGADEEHQAQQDDYAADHENVGVGRCQTLLGAG